MGLRNLTLPVETVKVADGVEFTVRGFSPNDAMGLYYRHTGQLAALFEHFANAGNDVDPANISAAIGSTVVSQAPMIMAEIIAIANGSNAGDAGFAEDVQFALNMPLGVQTDALQKIGKLTFSSDMPPGKFFAVVLQMARSAAANLPQQQAA